MFGIKIIPDKTMKIKMFNQRQDKKMEARSRRNGGACKISTISVRYFRSSQREASANSHHTRGREDDDAPQENAAVIAFGSAVPVDRRRQNGLFPFCYLRFHAVRLPLPSSFIIGASEAALARRYSFWNFGLFLAVIFLSPL